MPLGVAAHQPNRLHLLLPGNVFHIFEFAELQLLSLGLFSALLILQNQNIQLSFLHFYLSLLHFVIKLEAEYIFRQLEQSHTFSAVNCSHGTES